MSTTVGSNESSSATQKFFRKLHLNHAKNTVTQNELVQQPKKNVKNKPIPDSQKKTKRLSTLLSNRRQDQNIPEKKKTCNTEHGITSPPISPTPNKARQSRRPSEANRPQSPKRTASPAVMSDIVQNQILQEQLEKLATEREKRPESSLPSPPITPALITPDSELEPKMTVVDLPAVRPRRLRPASSFAALRPATNTTPPHHHTHYISRRPVSYIDSYGDYLIVKKPSYDDTPRKMVHHQRIHKRLSEHDLSPSDLSELLDERLLLCQLQHDTSSDSSQSGHQRIKRVDSAKSIGSVPEAKYEKLRNTLEKERAVVRALQKQKEACNRDVAFLSRNTEELTTENLELKKKLEHEKTMKERFQDDLSLTMDKLSEATEYIRKLENQNKQLQSEKDEKYRETKELKRYNKPTFDNGKSCDRLLAAQLRHSQNQVRILKSTMEQFLRMGVFNDELPSNVTSPTTSVDSVVYEQKSRQKSRQTHVQSKMATKTPKEKEKTTKKVPEPRSAIEKKKPEVTKIPEETNVPEETSVPEETNVSEEAKKPEEENKQEEIKLLEKDDAFDLDKQLRELMREKEILQGEYSKAPSCGGNALIRRRREELECKLDSIDSQMCRIKLKIRSRQIL